MYTQFYGFSEAPFNVTPDSRFLFLTPSHREALASMLYGIMERRGFISITGEVGTGKTTLVHTLLAKADKQVRAVFIFHTLMSFEEFLKTVLTELGISVSDQGKANLLHALNETLIQRLSQKENVALIIDEAQNLGTEVLEEIRLLSNLETSKSKLLQILLVGQPELENKLDLPELRQLKQRIGIRRKIDPLTPEESERYIDHRLKQVGSDLSKIFTKDAVALICKQAKGIPRTINTICDNALLIGYGLSKKKIDGEIIREVLTDLGEASPPSSSEDGKYGWESAGDSEAEETGPVPAREQRGTRYGQYLLLGVSLAVALVLFFFVGSQLFSGKAKKPGPPAKSASIPAGPKSADKPSLTEPKTESAPAVVAPSTSPAAPASAVPTPPEVNSVNETPAVEETKEKVVLAKRKNSIFLLARRHYRASNETLADLILAANPEITNIHLIGVGQEIKIPQITEELLIVQAPDKGYKIHLGTFENRRSLKLYEGEPDLKGKELELVPVSVAPQETWYRVLAGRFENKEECLKVIRTLKEKGLLPAFGS